MLLSYSSSHRGCFHGAAGGCWLGVQRALVEFVFENIVDTFVGANAGGIGTLAGGFQAFRGVAFGQAEDAQAGTVSLLRVPAGRKRPADQFGGLRADFCGPAQKALRGLLAVELVLGRHRHAVG